MIKEENRKLFSEIYKTYFSKIKKQALNILKDPDMTEDVCQTVFLNLFDDKVLHNLKNMENAHVSHYISKTTRNCCLDYLNKYGKEIPTDDYEDTLMDEDTLSKLLKRFSYSEISMLLDKVKIKNRYILYARYVLDMEVDEIVSQTHLSTGAVYKRLERGKKELKKELMFMNKNLKGVSVHE